LYYYEAMTRITTVGSALAMLALTSAPARADITAFIGANTTPGNRQVRGGSVGFGLILVLPSPRAYKERGRLATAPLRFR